jgi:NAD(P)-dependent dehydrogenase (short-subunit alcohol dehydrogenase family)
MAEQNVAVVTGVSSGIGLATAAELARQGFRVFGTVRSTAGAPPPGVELLVADVRDQDSIARAVADVVSRAGRIDALVNNAGSTIVGAVEETDTAEAQALFDVNFFGAVRMTRAVLPTMRAQRRGRVVFVSSIVGFLPAPFMAFYAATKHALSGYSQSLDHEVRGLGIRSVLVEPGFMKTRIGQNSGRAAAHIPDYAPVRERFEANLARGIAEGEDPSLVALVIREAIAAPRPRLRYQAGKGTGTLARLRGIVPEALDRSLRKEFHLDG